MKPSKKKQPTHTIGKKFSLNLFQQNQYDFCEKEHFHKNSLLKEKIVLMRIFWPGSTQQWQILTSRMEDFISPLA